MTTRESQNTSDLLEALQQQNLVYNYNFLYFSNKKRNEGGIIEYGVPDGWVYNDTDKQGTIGFEDDACKIVTTSNSDMTFQQSLHEFPRWQNTLIGQSITVKMHLHLLKDNEVSVKLSDGMSSTRKVVNATADNDYVVDLKLEVSNSATGLFVSLEANNTAVILVHKVYANIGQIALEGLPCIVKGIIGERKQYIATDNPPAEELSLCEAPKELNENQTRLNSVLNCQFGIGENSRSLLPDIRGYFSRVWNNGADKDPDAATREKLGDPDTKGDFVGTSEGDIFKTHVHNLAFSSMSNMIGKEGPGTGLNTVTTSETEKEVEGGGAETRPINFSELYTIKWA